jgi:hypothetical protein
MLSYDILVSKRSHTLDYTWTVRNAQGQKPQVRFASSVSTYANGYLPFTIYNP